MDHKIFVSSDGNNKPSRFINRLEERINLDSNIEYEIAILDVFHPKEVYTLFANDPESGYQIATSRKIYTYFHNEEIDIEE